MALLCLLEAVKRSFADLTEEQPIFHLGGGGMGPLGGSGTLKSEVQFCSMTLMLQTCQLSIREGGGEGKYKEALQILKSNFFSMT